MASAALPLFPCASSDTTMMKLGRLRRITILMLSYVSLGILKVDMETTGTMVFNFQRRSFRGSPRHNHATSRVSEWRGDSDSVVVLMRHTFFFTPPSESEWTRLGVIAWPARTPANERQKKCQHKEDSTIDMNIELVATHFCRPLGPHSIIEKKNTRHHVDVLHSPWASLAQTSNRGEGKGISREPVLDSTSYFNSRGARFQKHQIMDTDMDGYRSQLSNVVDSRPRMPSRKFSMHARPGVSLPPPPPPLPFLGACIKNSVPLPLG